MRVEMLRSGNEEGESVWRSTRERLQFRDLPLLENECEHPYVW